MLRISACVIVKNEEKNLPKWLECVKNIADEYIVVDTGSMDNTKQIAIDGGAKVYDFPWINDFSAAKNFAIDKAKGDWIIFLDADEYFHANDYSLIKRKIKLYDKEKNVDVLMCRLDNIDVDNNNKSLGITYQSRIFRNKKYIRYFGKVHEYLINKSKKQKTMQFIDGVKIYHTGYSESLGRIKAERNLKILLENKHEQTQKNYIYFVDCYWGLDDYEKVIYYARLHNKSNEQAYGVEGKVYLYYIIALKRTGRKWEEVDEALKEAKERYPRIYWIVVLEGIMLFEYKKYIRAEKTLEEIINKIERSGNGIITDELNIDYTQMLLPQAYLYLGEIRYKQKRKEEAMQYYISGLNVNRYDKFLLCATMKLLKNLDSVEIIQCLNKLYNEDDADFILQCIDKRTWPQLFLYYLPKCKKYTISHIEKLLLTSNTNAASKYLLDELSQDFDMLLYGLYKINPLEVERREFDILLPEGMKKIMEKLLLNKKISLELKYETRLEKIKNMEIDCV